MRVNKKLPSERKLSPNSAYPFQSPVSYLQLQEEGKKKIILDITKLQHCIKPSIFQASPDKLKKSRTKQCFYPGWNYFKGVARTLHQTKLPGAPGTLIEEYRSASNVSADLSALI